MIKLLLGMPVFQAVAPRPLETFLSMAIAAGDRLHGKAEISVRVHPRDSVVSAMNTFGQIVLDHDFDALIVGDDDCLPPVDAIPRLVQHFEHGHDFVSGVGFMRGYPHTTTVGRDLSEGLTVIQTPYGNEWKAFQWLDDLTGAPPLLQVDFCGVPLAIISRKCFERAERPWFGTYLGTDSVTHDIYFERRLKAAGIPIHVDTTIVCGHLADPAVIDLASRHRVRRVGQELLKAVGA